MGTLSSHWTPRGTSFWVSDFPGLINMHSQDLRLALERFLSRGTTRWLGTWVADLTMRSMISSAASSVTLGDSSVPIFHEPVDPERWDKQRMPCAQTEEKQKKQNATVFLVADSHQRWIPAKTSHSFRVSDAWDAGFPCLCLLSCQCCGNLNWDIYLVFPYNVAVFLSLVI